MNKAIINLIDKKMNDEYYSNPEPENWNWVLTWAFFENFIESLKNEISSPPSLDIDSLQRYEATEYPWLDWYYIEENDNWEYVRYESLVDLLRN